MLTTVFRKVFNFMILTQQVILKCMAYLTCISLGFLSSLTFAAENSLEQGQEIGPTSAIVSGGIIPSSGNRGVDLFNTENLSQVFIALIVVVFIILLLSVILKKINMLPGGNAGLIKIIAGLSLNNKDRLLLIQVGESQVLISSSPGDIKKICTLNKLISLEDLSTKNVEKSKFSQLLNSAITRQGS